MKKKFLLFLTPIIILIVILGLFVFSNIGNRKFYLEDSSYGQAGFTEIGASELDQLITNQKSFVLFIYQPACVTSADFEEILTAATQEKSSLFTKSPSLSLHKLRSAIVYHIILPSQFLRRENLLTFSSPTKMKIQQNTKTKPIS